jgi:hypothetical protein
MIYFENILYGKICPGDGCAAYAPQPRPGCSVTSAGPSSSRPFTVGFEFDRIVHLSGGNGLGHDRAGRRR